MTKPIPSIERHMTASPHAISVTQPLSVAYTLMKQHDIRHLPVLDGGALVGLLSVRDLHLIGSLKDVNPTKVSVNAAMSKEVYAVSPATPLHEVVNAMADHKYGCAVVMHQGKVVGIFTTIDVCRAFADLLSKRLA
jgi:acetoin utilization protein AcuB